MVNGELPSGQQAEDIWNHLQDKLWFADRKESHRKKVLIAANAERKASPVVIKEGESAEAVPVVKSAVASKWLKAQKKAAANTEAGDMAPTVEGKRNQQRELAEETTEDGGGGSMSSVKLESDGDDEMDGDGGVSPDDDKDDEATYGARPENWMHAASLVFAVFGRPAGKDEDVDLKLKMTGGLTSGSKRKGVDNESSPSNSEASPSTSEDGRSPGLSTRALKLMNGAGGKQSRSDVQKMNYTVNAENKKVSTAQAGVDLKHKILEALTSPAAESKSARELSASVAMLTKAVASKEHLDQQAAERARWTLKVEAKSAQLAMLERRGRGSTKKALDIEDELNELYNNPGVAPLPVVMPPVDTPITNAPSSAGGDGGGAEGGNGLEIGAAGGDGAERLDVDAPGKPASADGWVEIVEAGGEGVAGGEERDGTDAVKAASADDRVEIGEAGGDGVAGGEERNGSDVVKPASADDRIEIGEAGGDGVAGGEERDGGDLDAAMKLVEMRSRERQTGVTGVGPDVSVKE